MRIVWIDPLNYDPQFLNLLSIVLREAGHEVCVCSNAREVFPPPAGIEWVPFSRHGPFPLAGPRRPTGMCSLHDHSLAHVR